MNNFSNDAQVLYLLLKFRMPYGLSVNINMQIVIKSASKSIILCKQFAITFDFVDMWNLQNLPEVYKLSLPSCLISDTVCWLVNLHEANADTANTVLYSLHKLRMKDSSTSVYKMPDLIRDGTPRRHVDAEWHQLAT